VPQTSTKETKAEGPQVQSYTVRPCLKIKNKNHQQKKKERKRKRKILEKK
jgi:hypothetical protein